MKAAVTTAPGAPEMIQIGDVPKPLPKSGWVLIKVKAAGLNRSEIFTRQGHSPGVTFPRIQGIECVGEVEQDSTGTFQPGQQVAAIMGGMGRLFDGGYAEYTLVPVGHVFAFRSSLPWEVLGAVPEMFQTTYGSLKQALEVEQGEVLLIRGGTSSVGMLACQLANNFGLTVVATTRSQHKVAALKQNGAMHVLLDEGNISVLLRAVFPHGVDKVLELVGAHTLKDSLLCVRNKGLVCMTGILSGWVLKEFEPLADLPNMARLTAYSGDAGNINKELLQEFIDMVANGTITLPVDRTFSLQQAAEAHAYMESNQGAGKMVLVM